MTPTARTNRYPRFSGLRAASPASSKAKKLTPSTNTEPELQLHKILRRVGLRFRVHCSALPGKPDIVFAAARLVVFCDGDFWHGRNWRTLKPLLDRRANAEYWVAKITANRRRDARVGRELRAAGWCVVRVWETDVRSNGSRVGARILRLVTARVHAPHLKPGTRP